MQIVINISEESYKNIKEQVDKRDYPDMQIGRAIVDGTELKMYQKMQEILEKVDKIMEKYRTMRRDDFKNRIIGVDLNHSESEDEE